MPKKNSSVRKRAARRDQRDLDIEISFMEGVVRRDPEFVDALQVLGDDYTRRGRFQDGLQIDRNLARLRPDDPLVHYNLGCSLSLTANFEEAVRAIETAIDLGYRDFHWLARDPDLKPLRETGLFKRIQDKVRLLKP
jgi:Flp pilus assembly protein TadD